MIALAWIVGLIVAYLAIGFGIAAWDAPYVHQRLKDSAEYGNKSWQKRAEEARYNTFGTAIFWPFRGPYLLTMRIADKRNPDLIARDLARREQAIADREHEIAVMERRMEIGKENQ
jgi:hypothetical protein